MKKILSSLVGSIIAACITVSGLPVGSAIVRADEEPELPIYNIVIDDAVSGGYVIRAEDEEPVTELDTGTFIYPGEFIVTYNTTNGDPTIQEVKLLFMGEEVMPYTLEDYKSDLENSWEVLHLAQVESIVKSPDGKTLNINLVPAYYIFVCTITDEIELGLSDEEDDEYFHELKMIDATTDIDKPVFYGIAYTTYPGAILKIGAGNSNRIMSISFEDEEVDIDNCYGNNYYDINDYANDIGEIGVYVDVMPVKLFDIRWNNFDSAEREGDYIDSEEHLDHGSCRIVAVYEEQEDGSLEDVTDLYGSFVSKDGAVDSDGYGDVMIQSGHIIEFEFIPQRGYQLKTVLANGFPLEAQDDTPNHYLYRMPDTNIHFTATFEQAEDKVISDGSSNIKSAEVTFGDDEFEGGSAQVEITDTKQFSKSLDEGYEMVASMEISAFNVFTKANTDGDMWKNPVTDLSGKAELTLQTAAAVQLESGDVLYVAHDHGGSLEYLPVDLAADGSITIEPDGFSEFAIVIKKANPQTTTPEVTTTPAPASVVSTGESSGTTYMLGALYIAAATCVALAGVRAKKKENS